MLKCTFWSLCVPLFLSFCYIFYSVAITVVTWSLGVRSSQVDSLKSTIFDVHMYEVNAPTPQIAAATLNSLLKLGVPFFVGEFSNAQGGKNVAYQYIMDFCEKNGIGWMTWWVTVRIR